MSITATSNNKELSPHVLSVSDLTKSFVTGDLETRALNGLTFNVKKGDFISLEGPSGCGKSTLLSILSLLEKPTSGQFLLSGIDINNISFSEKSRVRNKYIGIVFQSFNLINTLNVLENVMLPASLYNLLSFESAKLKAISLLHKMGLEKRIWHKPEQLSGGQQQRVAIARALLLEPEIIFADEPTGNLDSENAELIINLFEELNDNGQTILMVTHDQKLAQRTKTRFEMFDGKIINQ